MLPTITPTTGGTLEAGSAFTLDLAADCNGSSVNLWTVNWGDGSSASTQQGPSAAFAPSHTYADGGSYAVRVRLYETNGDVATDTVSLTISDAAHSQPDHRYQPTAHGGRFGGDGSRPGRGQRQLRGELCLGGNL